MQPQQMPPPAPLSPPTHDYEFIVNPASPPRGGRLKLPGQNSWRLRLIMSLGAILALLILFLIIKNLLSSSPNLSAYVGVAQDQQELVHLSTNASKQPGITTANRNFAVTAELALASSQSQLLTYLKINHLKVKPKTLILKVSPSLDSQLTAAAANSTYDQTFIQIMQNQLAGYEQALKLAYNGGGPQGHKLLQSDYQQAQLFIKQLNAPAS